MRSAGFSTIVGAVLPVALGAALGTMTAGAIEGSVSYPMSPDAFAWQAAGLTVAHLLVAVGYAALARGTSGAARALLVVGAIGTVGVAGAETWSAFLAEADLDGDSGSALTLGFFVTATLIAIGTAGAGFKLWRSARGLALPLLVNGLFLGLVTIPVRFLSGSADAGVAMLVVWSLLYVWLGVVMVRRRGETL